MELKAFLTGKHAFAFLSTGFQQEFDSPLSSTGSCLVMLICLVKVSVIGSDR